MCVLSGKPVCLLVQQISCLEVGDVLIRREEGTEGNPRTLRARFWPPVLL